MRRPMAGIGMMESVRDDQAQNRLRSFLFSVGDCLFLMLVGIVATGAMHLVQQWGWSSALTSLSGMVLAMVVQTLLALSVAPILGSIESMIPSMVVAMVSAMAKAMLPMMGHELSLTRSLTLGAVYGVGMCVLIGIYGPVCKRSLCRTFPSP